MYFVLDKLDPKEQARVEESVRQVIFASLGEEVVRDVRFDWAHMSEDEAKVRIVIAIERRADPRSWRDGFAGLTSRIKAAMGERLDSVFPVLTAKAA